MIHVEEYHEYTGGYSVHQGVTMMHVGGYYHSCGGYHEHIGIFNLTSKAVINLLPHMNHDILPMY